MHSLAIRLGGAGSRWLPVRSRREALRTWASLTAAGRFAEAQALSYDLTLKHANGDKFWPISGESQRMLRSRS